jgi:hypothetical protein
LALKGACDETLSSQRFVLEAAIVAGELFSLSNGPTSIHIVLCLGHVFLANGWFARMVHEDVKAQDLKIIRAMNQVLAILEHHVVTVNIHYIDGVLIVLDKHLVGEDELTFSVVAACYQVLALHIVSLYQLYALWDLALNQVHLWLIFSKCNHDFAISMWDKVELLLHGEVLEPTHGASALVATTTTHFNLVTVAFVIEHCVVASDLISRVDVLEGKGVEVHSIFSSASSRADQVGIA